MSPFIHPAFWSDPEIEAAPSEVKLTVIWLITNSQTSIIGLCRATKKRFSFETGLPGEALQRACEALPKMLYAHTEGIWIRNYIHHQFGRGDKLTKNNCFKAIRAAFGQVREDAIRTQIVAQYPEFADMSQENNPSDSPSEPLGRGKVREGKDKEENSEGGQGETNPKAERKAGIAALGQRIGAIFGRKPGSKWTDKEKARVIELYPQPEEDLALMERFYAASIPKEDDFRRHDIGTLLNNWPGELDRARKFFVKPATNGHADHVAMRPLIAGIDESHFLEWYYGAFPNAHEGQTLLTASAGSIQKYRDAHP